MLDQRGKGQQRIVYVKKQIFSLLILYKKQIGIQGHGESVTLSIQMGSSLHNV